ATGLTVLAGWIFTLCFPDAGFPPLWANAIVGFVGGVAAEFGDMLASLVKRYCRVKDFGSLFPGHGGMMDRMDSILFSAVVIFCYHEILRFLA
ncbi:MAG: phosphatidate cytidylyltransferase, partial [Firmicutes bacterium]|nr:phosphatidate cytidylyltransferase [Bacillota bacterium]